jgi:rubredoxin
MQSIRSPVANWRCPKCGSYEILVPDDLRPTARFTCPDCGDIGSRSEFTDVEDGDDGIEDRPG